MSHYDEQGTGANTLPHVLTPRWDIDQRGWPEATVRWELECPYEGDSIPCGMWIPCTGQCGLPPEPQAPDIPLAPRDQLTEEQAKELDAWMEAHAEWRDEHPLSGHHNGSECWWLYMIANGDEPEFYLADMPHGGVVGQMKVQVGSEGYDEEAGIRLRPWKDDEPT